MTKKEPLSPEILAFLSRMREHHKRLFGSRESPVPSSKLGPAETPETPTRIAANAEPAQADSQGGAPQPAGHDKIEMPGKTPDLAREIDNGSVSDNKPTTASSPVLVILTSKTDEPDPGPRTRLKLGLSEIVVLTVTGGEGQWSCSGGKLDATVGTTVRLTAPARPGVAEVSVEVGGTKASLTFTVIAPNSVSMTVNDHFHTSNGKPNAGMILQPYLGPADVCFSEVSAIELEGYAKATGSWAEFNGRGHYPNPRRMLPLSMVTPGKGTQLGATDHAQSGWIDSDRPFADWSGTITIDIPWHWQSGDEKGLIAIVQQRIVTDAAGSTTISKGGASFTAALS